MSGTRDIARRAATVFLPIAVVAGAILLILFHVQDEAARSLTEAAEARVVGLGETSLEAAAAAARSDVGYLVQQRLLKSWIDTADAAARQELAADYLIFATAHSEYDKIRLIDTGGNEIIRIDHNSGLPRIVPDMELASQADRYFVADILKLNSGEIYQSPFDLTVERGVAVTPDRPVIRFGAPIFDSLGRKRGLVVVNYLGQVVIDHLRKIGEGRPAKMALVNGNGDWLLAPEGGKDWAFVHPGRAAESFATKNPEAWKQMSSDDGPAVFYVGDDLYTFVRIAPQGPDAAAATTDVGVGNPASALILMTVRAGSAVTGAAAELRRTRLVSAAVMFLLLAVASWAVARGWAARRQAEEATRKSESRFRKLIESAPDAVIIVNRAGTIVLANAQTKALFGYEREELVGKPIETVVPERFRSVHVGHRAGYLAAARPRPMGNGLELSGFRRDGSEFPVAISLSPIVVENETMIFCDVRDISAEKRAEERIKELNQDLVHRNTELEAVNREIESFSYSVSHDLRAPLRAIDGFSQALAEDAGDRLDEGSKSHLKRIRLAAQRMGFLIDDLLKLARVTRAELAIGEIDLSELAGAIATDLKQSHPERRGQFTIAPGMVANGDPRLMRVVLENLLSNAWKFTGKRDTAEISFGHDGVNGQAAYFVRDNGAGFDMEYAGRLFGAFQRLHDAGSFPGNGVGLATVQRIIAKHGGRVWADAKPDNGATFYFTLAA